MQRSPKETSLTMRGLNLFALAIFSLGLLLINPVSAATDKKPKETFHEWLVGFKEAALKAGVSKATVDKELQNLSYSKKIVSLDRKQPETTVTFQQYIDKRVSPRVVATGEKYIKENRQALLKVSRHYQVEPEIIAAIWGAESNYGTYPMKHDVVQALATLSYDNRRRNYFTKELIAALKILDAKHIDRASFKGSWAGALGQTQFMPSNYLRLAQDFNKDGRKDIWHTPEDVFASIAHYLKKHGWQAEQPWAVQVQVPEGFNRKRSEHLKNPKASPRALRAHSQPFKASYWKQQGIVDISAVLGGQEELMTSLYIPKDSADTAYLTFPNYRSILRYNPSNYYALSVSLLADKLQPYTRPIAMN